MGKLTKIAGKKDIGDGKVKEFTIEVEDGK